MSEVFLYNLSAADVDRDLDQFWLTPASPPLSVIDLFIVEHGRALALELSQGLYDRRWLERYRFFAESVARHRPTF
jgi:hypothetical protein